MVFVVKDGNTGQTAKVIADSEKNGRLLVQSATESNQILKAISGQSFTLIQSQTNTTDALCAFMYIKNTSKLDLLIYRYTWYWGGSDGVGDGLVYFNTNDPTGEIVTSKLPITLLNNNNLNLRGTETFEGLVYGGNGNAMTIGSGFSLVLPIRNTESERVVEASTVLKQGNSVALGLQSPTGNTYQRSYLSVQCYYRG